MFHLFFFLGICGLGYFVAWRTWKIGRMNIKHLKKLHQIPCPDCMYFTGDYRLKCPVHPIEALSEEALNCKDFEPKTYQYRSSKSTQR